MSREAPRIVLRCADTQALLAMTRDLFLEYARSLEVDLCFQNFEAELAGLPGRYGAPTGTILLAFVDDKLAGCGAMRALVDADQANACEMKRVYVRPGFRGLGIGRALVEGLLDEARRAGYSAVLLDTLDAMEAARALYATLGFVEIPPYYFNPIGGTRYLRAELG